MTYHIASAEYVRSAIAKRFNSAPAQAMLLGCIELQPHQISALTTLQQSIDEFGGVLLSDPVGTGKTYTALALAPADETVVVVAPAALRDMWTHAAATAQRRIVFHSFESLSRGSTANSECGLLIIDEAHHARNASTRRYAVLSRLCAGKSVVMLSATPIHNRTKDLQALLSLFMGGRAASLSSAEIARCVIRRSHLTRLLIAMPRADEVIWCGVDSDDRVPSVLLDLPPPLPPRDGGDGGALVIHSLIRQWASSDAALIGGLRRRLTRAEAMMSALEDGTWPSRSELSSWISGEDVVQLAFSNLLASPSEQSRTLLPTLHQHRDALANVLRLARESCSDEHRASLIRGLRERHGDRKIVVFSQFADTVAGMFRLLCRDGHVAALSGSGGHVAGGVISRRDVIDRFAPLAMSKAPPRTADDVTLLITTDLLSEGINLQDAGGVIHLDLPWTPARIEQRLGRIARLGSRHARVVSYAFRPPATAAAIIRIETILKRKLQDAGVVVETLPSFGEWTAAVPSAQNSSFSADVLSLVIREWQRFDSAWRDESAVAAAVCAPCSGFLAAYESRGHARMVGCIDGRISDELPVVLRCAQLAGGPSADCSLDGVAQAHAALTGWSDGRKALAGARESSSTRSSGRNKALRRIDRAVSGARLHERAIVVHKAREARMMLDRSFGVHADSELSALCETADSDAVWLDRLVTLARRLTSKGYRDPGEQLSVFAIIVFRSGS